MASHARSPTHQWSDDERLTLCLLHTFYKIHSKEIAIVMNGIFCDDLPTQPFRDTTVSTMLWELKHNRSDRDPWKTISTLSMARLRHKYWKQKNTIEDVALTLAIPLVLRNKEEYRGKDTLLQRLKKVYREQSTRNDTPSSGFSIQDSSADETPCQRSTRTHRRWVTTSDQPLSVRLHTKTGSDGQPTRKHPVLLFRAFETSHGFRSRRFLQSEPTQPPQYVSPRFKKLVNRHLTIEKAFDSPFISLTQYDRAAIRYLDDRENCSIAVFSFNDLQADAQKRFSGVEIPYLVPTVCKDHRIDDLPRGYNGRGEWLCWGTIEANPIAIWTLAEVLDIKNTMEAIDSISYESGRMLGKCLSEVPFQWQATIAYKLLWSYQVNGCARGSSTPSFQAFVQGIYVTSSNGCVLSFHGLEGQLSVLGTEEEEIIQYSSTPVRNRRRLLESDDEDIEYNLSEYFTGNRQSIDQVAPANIKAFRQRVAQFVAEDVLSTQKEAGIPYSPLSPGLNGSWEVIDLTTDNEQDDDTKDEIVFQGARRMTQCSKTLSIRSKSVSSIRD